MPTYEIEFESGGKTMLMDVEGERAPTPEEAQGLIQQHLGEQQRQLSLQDPAGQLFEQPGPQPARAYVQPEQVSEPSLAAPVSAAPLSALPTATPQTQPETSIGPMLYGAVQGAADIASIPETLASLIQLPQKGIQRLLGRALPESVRPPEQPLFEPPQAGAMVERQARALLAKVGIPDESLDPDTRTEQFIQRVVREVTGVVVGLPAIRAMKMGGTALQEIGMATAQGVGAATAQQVAPGNVAAEIAGQLAPNAVGLVHALARNLGTRLVPDPDVLRAKVSNALRETIGDPAQAEQNMQRALSAQAAAPGLQPTLPEATGAPGLIALQRSQRAADPLLAGQLAQRRSANIDTITDTLDELFKGGDPDDVRSSVAQTQKRVQARLQERVETAQQRLASVQEAGEARLKRSQARINERVTKAQGAVRDETQALVGGEPGADVGRLAKEQMAVASKKARDLYQEARQTFRKESAIAYENIDPANEVNGAIGKLHENIDNIARRAALSFDQQTMPRSFAHYYRTVKARASKPVQMAKAPADFANLDIPESNLLPFIRQQGGINLSAETELVGEFEALIRNRETGTTGLFRLSGGLTPQEMAERAQEAGIIYSPDKEDLLEALRDGMKTGKTYGTGSTAFGEPIDEFYLNADAIPIDETGLADVNVSINDLRELRSQVLREKRLLRGADAPEKGHLLDEMRLAVEKRMRDLAREQGRPDVYERIEKANQFYAQNIGKFTTGAGEHILRQTNRRYAVSNAQVIREFLKTPEDAVQFVDGIGNRDAALAAMEQYLDAELYLKAVDQNTGRLKVQNARSFMLDRHEMFRMFPELRERYGDIAKLEQKARYVEDASKRISQRATRRVTESEEFLDAQERAARVQASVQQQQQRLAREPGNAILKDTLDNGGIAQIMQRSDANSQLIRIADTMRDNPEARQGIARAMWQEFLRREGQRAGRDPISDNPILNDQRLSNFINRYSQTLNHLYGAEHVANLRKVAEGLRISRVADRPPVQMGSPTAELLQHQRTFLGGAARAAVPISMPIANLKLRLLRFAGRQAINYIQSKREQALQAITQEILYDPDIAKTFALLRDPKTAARGGMRLKAHMLMLGAENRFDDPEGEE